MKEYNKYYWENKSQRTEIAKKHTREMDSKYAIEINESVKNTKVYSVLPTLDNLSFRKENIRLSVKEKDSVSALLDCKPGDGRVAILNFASYKHPGGGFMVGSRAQEESLCHESFLYNVLREFDNTYYEENRNALNKGLYKHRALYSPNVRFIRDNNETICDVITCAAPNFSAAERHVSREYNNRVLTERVRFVLDIAKRENVDTFIVGAFGCGVFRQDPKVLADCFEREMKKVFVDKKIHIIFAVIPPLPNQSDNLTPFIQLVQKWNKI